MAQFFDDFGGFSLAEVLPPYMTAQGGITAGISEDAASENNRVLRFETSSNGGIFIEALPATTGDSEIVVRARHNSTSSSFLVRPRHTEATKSAVDGTLYEHRNNGLAGDIRQRNPGLTTLAAGSGLQIADPSSFYFIRIQYVSASNTVRTKLWDGTVGDEPSAWLLSTTGSISAALLGRQSIAGFNTGFARVDWIGIGTNGDPAPTSPISSAVPTLSTPTATATTSNSISFSIPVSY